MIMIITITTIKMMIIIIIILLLAIIINNTNSSTTNNKITEISQSRVRIYDTVGGAGWVEIANRTKKS